MADGAGPARGHRAAGRGVRRGRAARRSVPAPARPASRRADATGTPPTPVLRDTLRAYAAGVNACLDGLFGSGKLPVEFVLARFSPEPWEPLDTLAFARYFAFSLSANWESELVRSRLIARLGYAVAASLEPDVWQPDTDALPRLEDWGPAGDARRSASCRRSSLPGGPGASNAWVVSGARSSTGKPLLANDPHLFPRMPSVFYEIHLAAGGELNVAGASAPGAPGVLIGHNRHIAWGITASTADVADLYVERIDPGDARRTEFDGHWETGTLIREVIAVKGRAEPWVEEVLVTRRHGPLITPTPGLADEHRPLALRSMVLEAPSAAAAMLAINRATSWDEFRAAASALGHAVDEPACTPTSRATSATRWSAACRCATRGEGLVPSPGWSGQYEWRGTIDFDEPAARVQPARRAVGQRQPRTSRKHSPHFFSREFIDPARYQRIRQVLESKERHSAVDFGALQADEVSLPARRVAAACWSSTCRRVGRLEAARAGRAARLGRSRRRRLRGGEHLRGLSQRADPRAACRGARRHAAGVARRRAAPAARRGDVALLFADAARARLSRGVARAIPPCGGRSTPRSVWLSRRLGPERRRLAVGPRAPAAARARAVDSQAAGHAVRRARLSAGAAIWKPSAPAAASPASSPPAGPISAYRLIADCGDWDNTPVLHPRRPERPPRLAALRRPGRRLAPRGIPPARVHPPGHRAGAAALAALRRSNARTTGDVMLAARARTACLESRPNVLPAPLVQPA